MLKSAQTADPAKDEKKRDQKHQRPHRKNSRNENTESQRQCADPHTAPRAKRRRSRRVRRRIPIHAFPLLSRLLPAPFYTKAAVLFLLYHGKASIFSLLSFIILDIFSSSCNIRTTSFYRGSASVFRTDRNGKDGTPHAGNEQKKPAFYRLRHSQNDPYLQRMRRNQSRAGLPRF